jgi:hypothetical protein
VVLKDRCANRLVKGLPRLLSRCEGRPYTKGGEQCEYGRLSLTGIDFALYVSPAR